MTLKDFLRLDATLTKKMRIAEEPGPLRTLAAFFAHSGDSWFHHLAGWQSFLEKMGSRPIHSADGDGSLCFDAEIFL